MDPEEKKLLEENIRVSEENNKLLLKVFNMLKWSQISRVLYWLILIGISVGAFYFVQPLLSNLFGIYSGGVKINNVNDIKSLNNNDFSDLLNSIK